MKQMFFLFLLTILLGSCASTNTGSGTGTGLSLMDAIEQTGEKIAGELPKGSRVAIVAFESVNDNVSDYIMEELTGALFDRGIEVADRQNLEYVYKELNLQMSGDVSDESAKSIGKFLAADMVITGQLLDLDGVYRYRTSAISVETAVRASVTRLDVRSDTATRRMITALANQKTTVKVAKYGVSEDRMPQTAGTFLDRGIMFASRGDYQTAIADFTEAIRLNPNMSAAYMLRGRALFSSVSRVTSIGDNFSGVNVISRRGEITAEHSRVYEQAIADFTQAIRLDPNNAQIYLERGNAYDNKGDFDKAIADLTQAIRLNPNYSVAYSNRGNNFSYKGEYNSAIADHNQAIRLDPNYASAYYSRGFTYHEKGDFDLAIVDYTEAIRLDSNYSTAFFERGTTYLTKGDFDKAISDFTQTIRLGSNDDKVYYGRACAYLLKNDLDNGIADFTRAIQLYPNYAYYYFYRGVAYNLKGDLDLAIADWETTLRLDPNNADARQNLENARRGRRR